MAGLMLYSGVDKVITTREELYFCEFKNQETFFLDVLQRLHHTFYWTKTNFMTFKCFL